jgi:ComF family protein
MFRSMPMRHVVQLPRFTAPSVAKLRIGARQWVGLGLNLVFPPACAACQVSLEPGTSLALCTSCRNQFFDARAACSRCGLKLPAGLDSPACPQCRDHRLRFTRVLRLGPYEGNLRSAVLRIKRPNERALAVALGDMLGETFAAQLSQPPPEVIIPVPMHWTRRAWRGTNSPHTVAGRLAARLEIPLATHLLVRSRRTAPQAALSPNKRRANVRGAFRVRFHRDLPGARVLLVDDIMTTGATLNEAAKVLAKAGAGEITVAVLARAEGLA